MIVNEKDMKIILNNFTSVDIMSFVPEGYAIMGIIDEWDGYTFYINRITHHIIAVRDSEKHSEVLTEKDIRGVI